MQSEVTTEIAARCLEILQAAGEPIVAAGLASRLGLAGKRETQRRHVRAIIEQLRSQGSRIIATHQSGYFLTDDDRLWSDYLEGRQIDAKRVLGVTHKQKKILTDSEGQGLLFTKRIPCGCASVPAY